MILFQDLILDFVLTSAAQIFRFWLVVIQNQWEPNRELFSACGTSIPWTLSFYCFHLPSTEPNAQKWQHWTDGHEFASPPALQSFHAGGEGRTGVGGTSGKLCCQMLSSMLGCVAWHWGPRICASKMGSRDTRRPIGRFPGLSLLLRCFWWLHGCHWMQQ